jgi:hypothetical protein
MEHHKLNPETAELIINTLRNNPGVDFTLSQLSDETVLPADELAAYCEDLTRRMIIEQETTPDGHVVYRFPDAFQRGTMAPS